ncbi:MAG: hypothetical protein ACE5G8_14125, partial [Anaerolineae bacterium]
QATAVWWLPAQGESDIEAALLNTFGPARDDTLDGQRLVLLARPDGPPRRVNLRLESDIRLQSARLSRRLQPNHPFAVTLVWRAERPPPDDYHVFVHLLNAQGEIAAQSDGRPVHWTRPTSGWRPAETITDRRALWIPALPPGPYTLIAGLYLPATGRRLPAESGAGFIQLAEFQIQ